MDMDNTTRLIGALWHADQSALVEKLADQARTGAYAPPTGGRDSLIGAKHVEIGMDPSGNAHLASPRNATIDFKNIDISVIKNPGLEYDMLANGQRIHSEFRVSLLSPSQTKYSIALPGGVQIDAQCNASGGTTTCDGFVSSGGNHLLRLHSQSNIKVGTLSPPDNPNNYSAKIDYFSARDNSPVASVYEKVAINGNKLAADITTTPGR